MSALYRTNAIKENTQIDRTGAEPQKRLCSGFKTAAPNTGPGRNKTPKERIKE